MTPEEHTKVMQVFTNDMLELAKGKSIEYAKDADELANFNRAAAEGLSKSPLHAAISFMTKHVVSLLNAADDPKSLTNRQWYEKCLDIAIYAVLIHEISSECLNPKQAEKFYCPITGRIPACRINKSAIPRPRED